jgi:uncharacterized protein YutE (UPF0331/DUF86 family)
MIPGKEEIALMEGFTADLEAEGYEVYVQPSSSILPKFMRGFLPDAIARKPGKNLVIEIVREGQRRSAQLEELRKLISEHDDWQLRLLLVTPSNIVLPVEVSTREEIARTIANAEELAESRQLTAALLLAWAAFEALGRALLPERFVKPQTPRRLVEVLASSGYVTPTEADHIRSLIDSRNKFIHGALSTSVKFDDIKEFIKILRSTLRFLKR